MEAVDYGRAERSEHREGAPPEPQQIPPSAKPKAPNRDTRLIEIGSEKIAKAIAAEHRHHEDIMSPLTQAGSQIHRLALKSAAAHRTDHQENSHYRNSRIKIEGILPRAFMTRRLIWPWLLSR
jgi:hypothetical protein